MSEHRCEVKARRYYVYDMNCDCASYVWARTPPRGHFMRCRYCGRELGHMQFTFRGSVMAKNEVEAMKLTRQPRPTGGGE